MFKSLQKIGIPETIYEWEMWERSLYYYSSGQ